MADDGIFKVKDVIDGDTFSVSPDWKWNDEKGDVVRPTGYDTPEEGQQEYQAAKDKLSKLILGKNVKLTNPATIDRGRLVCDVFLDGKNLADYFPEYIA